MGDPSLWMSLETGRPQGYSRERGCRCYTCRSLRWRLGRMQIPHAHFHPFLAPSTSHRPCGYSFLNSLSTSKLPSKRSSHFPSSIQSSASAWTQSTSTDSFPPTASLTLFLSPFMSRACTTPSALVVTAVMTLTPGDRSESMCTQITLCSKTCPISKLCGATLPIYHTVSTATITTYLLHWPSSLVLLPRLG